MDVEFEDLVFTVTTHWIRREEKRVLDEVSGRFRVGELSAILGPSGAGKSSLLNAVSGFRIRGVSGEMKVNGETRDEQRFRKMSCYIMQDDLLQPMMTAGEMMQMAARLKLPRHTTKKARNAAIHGVMETLGLLECQDTRTEDLSGGQRRRLSVALELVNNPPVLFLDEPTSGLDVVTSGQLVQMLRRLAEQGRTVICTIHQPSATLFSLFHHVYVLSRGRCVYQGPTHQLVPFLSSLGLSCPTTYNPADFVIEVTDRDHEENIAVLSSATGNGKLTMYITSTNATQLPNDFSQFENNNEVGGDSGRKTSWAGKTDMEASDVLLHRPGYRLKRESSSNSQASCYTQFWIILTRMILQISRNRIGLQIQFWHHVFCAVAVGIMFWGVNQQGDQFFNHMKFCVGTVLLLSYTQCMVPVLQFPFEVKLLKKEHFNGWYSLNSYFMALSFSKVPTIGFFSLMYLTMVYFMSGLPVEMVRFGLFCLIGLIVAFIAESMGLAIGSVFSITNGSAVGPLLLAPLLGFAVYGFDFVREIPWYIEKLINLSFIRSATVGYVLTLFSLDRKPLDCPDPYCPFQDPKVTLHFLDLEHVSAFSELPILIMMLLIFKSFSYLGLTWRLKR